MNILLITADDMDGDTPGRFGGLPGVTPALDRLADQGLAFHRAHVPIAVCMPSRSAIMTGRWPHRNGAQGFEPIDDSVAVLTDLLSNAGYRNGILGKVDHLAPVERFGWHYVKQKAELGMGRDPRAYGASAAEFMHDAAASGQPWFLMANAHDPHRPFHGSDQEQQQYDEDQRRSYPAPTETYSPEHAVPPGFLPDLAPVRREVAEYLSSSRRCDDVVGAVLQALHDSGQTDRTVVVFLSDNGMAFPYAKANCYLRSTRTPLIARWPGLTRGGAHDATHFVSCLDLFPTFCEAAGVDTPDGLDGTTLTGLFAGAEEPDRDYVATVFHETSAKRRYEMRCIQNDRYGYVWNDWADGRLAYKAENMSGRTWSAMRDSAATDDDIERRVAFYLHRAQEELYDLVADPDCVHDLADNPEYADVLAAMRAKLRAWMTTVDDPLMSTFGAPDGA